MKEEYYQIKKSHPDYLIIIHKGKHGEIYGKDADMSKEIINMKKDKDGVIRFSWNLLDSVLRTLIHNGIKVAVKE